MFISNFVSWGGSEIFRGYNIIIKTMNVTRHLNKNIYLSLIIKCYIIQNFGETRYKISYNFKNVRFVFAMLMKV